MLAIQGVHVQEQFVREHPQHWGIGKLRSEAIEGWIGLCKQYQRKHGNYNLGWLKRLYKFIDLYTLGAVLENLIDFSAIEHKHYLYQKLIYEKNITDKEQSQLEAKLPVQVKNILYLVDKIKFREEIPDELQELLTPDAVALERMTVLMQNVNTEQLQTFYLEHTDDEDEISDESDQSNINVHVPKRKTRQQHFEEIHSQRC